jgi:hypothetical protein
LNNNFDHVKGVLKLMERMTDDNTEPLLETIYDKYNNDALVFNEMLIENMIKSNDYNTNKLISLKSTIISKKK